MGLESRDSFCRRGRGIRCDEWLVGLLCEMGMGEIVYLTIAMMAPMTGEEALVPYTRAAWPVMMVR